MYLRMYDWKVNDESRTYINHHRTHIEGMEEMSQSNDLYNYLYTHGSIEPKEAWKHLGIYRLSARISDLRKDGVNITTVTVDDGKSRFARYVLEGK